MLGLQYLYLKTKTILELAFWKKENNSVSHHWSGFFFNCKFLEKLKELDNNKHLYTCLPLCVCVCVCYLLSRVQLLAHQAPLSLGFSRQEYWSG